MDIITKIEIQKNNKERVNIYVNDEYFVSIYAELVYKFNLKKGQEIKKDILKEIIHKENYIKAKNKAFNILSKCDQSEKTLKEKLTKDFDDDIVLDVLSFLKENKLINDEFLAKKIINTNVNLNKYGKNKIKQNLYKKGIENNHINSLINDLDEDKEFENALFIANKKYEKIKGNDKNKIHQKLYSHLIYRGFDFDTTKKVIKKLLNTDDF